MGTRRTIGAVSRDTGLPIRTIRFYEAEGVLPAPTRTPGGYRLYSPIDVRRLRLIRNARALGLGLTEIRTLVEQAFASDCRSFAPQLQELIATKRRGVAARIRELKDLEEELNELERHVQHAACATVPGQLVSDCDYCPMIDEQEESPMKSPHIVEAVELLDSAFKNRAHSPDLTQQPDVVEALYGVGCDIAARPKGAPTLDDIQPHITNIRRDLEDGAHGVTERLTVEFDPVSADTIAAYVAAEQKCCSDIRFTLAPDNPSIMHIDAPSQLLDVVAGWITPA